MASQLIGGGRNQEWVNRGARERAFTRFAGTGFFVLLGALVFETALFAYVASLPREKAVIIAEQRDGSYAPYSEAQAPDEGGKIKLLADWVASWRLGSSDPKSLSAIQTAALIPTGLGAGDVAREVRDYNQQVADGGLTVTPIVRSAVGSGSGFDYEVDEDETVAVPLKAPTQRALRIYVTIAFDDARVNLHNDALMNPYGMYVKSLRVVEVNVGHAH
ncbi:MAG: hypothetical protein ACLPSH_10230 [Vulcanimicrobiaceae bacterium]